jgi:Fur family ferric uptake transcriptional regulator
MMGTCDFRRLLEHHHTRPTILRLAVLEVLGSARRAWRPQEILQTIRQKRRINKVTIYRILENMWRLGIVRKIALEGKACHYELACDHHPPHPHFQCHGCGETQCLEPLGTAMFLSELQGWGGNLVDTLEIRIGGFCPKCQARGID